MDTNVKPHLDLENIVATIYREAIGKDPSPTFIDKQMKDMAVGLTLENVIERLFRSSLYKKNTVRRFQQECRAIYSFADVPQDPQTLSRLFEKTSQYWRQASAADGTAAQQPGSARGGAAPRAELEERKKFIASGSSFVDKCVRILKAFEYDQPEKMTALDFGCGGGRLTVHAASRFQHVHAVDFFIQHLVELNSVLSDLYPWVAGKVTTREVRVLADLTDLPQVDFLFSHTFLQHNTPPVIAHILRGLLSALKPHGMAIVQIPLYIPLYSFDTKAYLSDEKSGTTKEMHLLPKENMRKVAAECQCRLVDAYGAGSGGAYSELIVFQKS